MDDNSDLGRMTHSEFLASVNEGCSIRRLRAILRESVWRNCCVEIGKRVKAVLRGLPGMEDAGDSAKPPLTFRDVNRPQI